MEHAARDHNKEKYNGIMGELNEIARVITPPS